jgi:predicted CXXCH cytochrome family protein
VNAVADKAREKAVRLKLIIMWLVLIGSGWFSLAQSQGTPSPTQPPTGLVVGASTPLAGTIYPPVLEDNLPEGAFRHDQHPTGDVAIVDKELIRFNDGKPTIRLDCNYCHIVRPEEVRTDGFGQYPFETPAYLQQYAGRQAPVKHSACTGCHSFAVTPGNRARMAKLQVMCAVCHNGPKRKRRRKNKKKKE